jgi:uncharacterized protein (DUF1330 family)
MSTYLINHLRIPGGIPNGDALSYLEQVEGTARPYGGTWLANGEVSVVEGAWPGLAVLMEFPSREASEQWYNSPEYQRILPLRVNNAISDIVLIDSLPADYTVRGFARQVRAAVESAPDSTG